MWNMLGVARDPYKILVGKTWKRLFWRTDGEKILKCISEK